MKIALTTKHGEVITIKKFNSVNEAINYFASLKNLSVDELLNIFSVVELS